MTLSGALLGRRGFERSGKVMFLAFITWDRSSHTCNARLSDESSAESGWRSSSFHQAQRSLCDVFFSFPPQVPILCSVTLLLLPSSWSKQNLGMFLKVKTYFSKFTIFQKMCKPFPGTNQRMGAQFLNSTEPCLPSPGTLHREQKGWHSKMDLCCSKISLKKMQECTH